MPKFRVKGCFKENAEDLEIILEATSYKDAEKIANKKGILVSDVLPLAPKEESNGINKRVMNFVYFFLILVAITIGFIALLKQGEAEEKLSKQELELMDQQRQQERREYFIKTGR